MNQGRIAEKLNLDWKFLRGDEPEAWYKGFDDSRWQSVALPHDWSVSQPFSLEHSSGTGYLPGGIGWYRKRFFLPDSAKGKKVYITFEGIYNNAQVWCNSYYMGKRPYGYSTFTYDITDFAAFGQTANIVSVKVNHKDISDSRWFTGSGIYRNVYITVTDRVHFENNGVFVTTPEASCEHAAVNVNARLSNETALDTEVCVQTFLADAGGTIVARDQTMCSLRAGSSEEVFLALGVDNPRLWSPETPYLYTVLTRIHKDGENADQVNIPIGIRWFKFDPDRGFSINGANMKIKGVCNHHDAGCLGAAVPAKVWARRLDVLKKMGCNSLRMSHNPPAPDLLDLCDKMGFLVMDEAFDEWEGAKNKWTTGHNVYPPKHFGYYEEFPQWAETDIKDMVLRDRNHPSIILWSIGNEIDYPNDPYCHPTFGSMTGNNDANKPLAERAYDPDKPNAERIVAIARRLAGYVKECDTTRPVTAAVAFPELSNLTGYSDVPDVTGYNYKEHLYKEDHRMFPGRVIYGSENSHSLESWLAVRDNDHICAQFIWTGVDFLGEAQGWPIRASRSGFLDMAGYKKSDYYYRMSLWSPLPMVYLAVRKHEAAKPDDKRGFIYGEPHWNWEAGEKVDVICYTNCEEAELFINGTSAGRKKLKDFPRQFAIWEADFSAGSVSVIAQNGEGAKYSCELKTTAEPRRMVAYADTAELTADGQDIAHVDLLVADGGGYLVYQADNMIRIQVEGPGELIGLENGDAGDLEPYGSGRRRACHGRLLAYIRAKTVPGKIVVKAEAQGLEPASITMDSVSFEGGALPYL